MGMILAVSGGEGTEWHVDAKDYESGGSVEHAGSKGEKIGGVGENMGSAGCSGSVGEKGRSIGSVVSMGERAGSVGGSVRGRVGGRVGGSAGGSVGGSVGGSAGTADKEQSRKQVVFTCWTDENTHLRWKSINTWIKLSSRNEKRSRDKDRHKNKKSNNRRDTREKRSKRQSQKYRDNVRERLFSNHPVTIITSTRPPDLVLRIGTPIIKDNQRDYTNVKDEIQEDVKRLDELLPFIMPKGFIIGNSDFAIPHPNPVKDEARYLVVYFKEFFQRNSHQLEAIQLSRCSRFWFEAKNHERQLRS
ncbi:hypothetical protein M231_04053 [Tremella mesenterica]|uniref:Uncharacterized protein n=1 Tax=Tremella mesenterica TaxID=5217 RepID=A0A4Q1BLK7_TREME|nr:hypothetical protein M231_04053 [Tremella mesenterica]